MKKILFLVQLPPPVHGVSVCNKMVVESELIKASYATRVLPIKFSKSLKEMQRHGPLKVFKLFSLLLKLMFELSFYRPNVVYFTLSPVGWSFLRDAICVLLIKLFRVKIIYHLHGKGIANESRGWFKALYRQVFKGNSVICLSARLAKDIEGVKSNANVYLCPNGVGSSVVEIREILDKLGASDKPEFLYLSNLSKSKGVDLYLKAAAQLLAEGVEAVFHLAGPFNHAFTQQDLDQLVAENPDLTGALIYHGSVHGQLKADLFARADVLVHPSSHDAFPLVILEAMAAGCVIVSSHEGGIPDMLADTEFGFLVEPLCVATLKDTLSEVLGQKLRFPSMQVSAIKRFQTHYTQQIFERRMLTIFDTVGKGV